jgi:hypothetical protein
MTMPLLGQQILSKQPVAGRRKHILMETISIRERTVFSVGLPQGYIMRRIEGVLQYSHRVWDTHETS